MVKQSTSTPTTSKATGTRKTTRKKPVARKTVKRKVTKPVVVEPAPVTPAQPRRGGRPTVMGWDKVDAAQKYYDDCKDGKTIPFVEELAVYYLDVDRNTVTDWVNKADDKEWLKDKDEELANQHKEFSRIIKRLNSLQLYRYKREGIDGKNTTLIFLMKADHGMVETSRTEVSGPGGEPIRMRAIQVMGSMPTAKDEK